jgi:anti-sigma regulatory factor (Ser/Thr protein kinase)
LRLRRRPGPFLTLCPPHQVSGPKAFGIVVTELVTNNYDHAFPGGKGAINVSMRRAAGDVEMANMTISDNGGGLKAKSEFPQPGQKSQVQKRFSRGKPLWSSRSN